MNPAEAHRSSVARIALSAIVALVVLALVAMPEQAHAATFTTGSSSYKIVYKLNGGTQPKKQVKSIKKDKTVKVSKLKNPKRAGYTFAGWYKNKKLTKKATVLKGVKSAKKRRVYAKWNVVTYGIYYNANGGAVASSVPRTYTVKKRVALPLPVRAGYAFAGWYSDAGLTNRVSAIDVGSVGNKYLYAKWVKRFLIAHRGYHADVPQNSIAAFRAAKDKGFAYVETDVRFTQDGVAVLNHDLEIPVLANAKDGTTLNLDLPISVLTFEELQKILIDQDETGPNGENVATFADFVKECKALGLNPVIDLKEGTSTQIKSLAKTVESQGLQYRARWVSTSATLLSYVRAVTGKASLEYNTRSLTASKIDTALDFASNGSSVFFGMPKALATPANIARVNNAGLPVVIWTLADETAVGSYDSRAAGFFVNGLVADRVPDLV